MAAATVAASGAETSFTAEDWYLNPQTFNKVDGQPVTTLTVNDNVITATYPATAAETLSRFEITTKADVTMGAGVCYAIVKVKYNNCNYSQIQVAANIARQNYIGNDNKGDQQTPFFATNVNLFCERMPSPNNNQQATEGYFWMNFSRSGVVNSGTCDWNSDPFVIYGNHYTNGKFTVDGENLYGRDWFSVRFVHQATNTNEIAEGASIEIPYIGVVSAEKLGINAEMTKNQIGAQVRAYINDILEGGSTSIAETLTGETLSVKAYQGIVTAAGADAIEVYTMAGALVASVSADSVEIPAGLYIVRATAQGTAVTAKVMVK